MRAELDLLAGELRDVDRIGPGELVLEVRDLPLDQRLAFARRVVFGVFRQVAMLARFRDRTDDGGTLDALERLQLGLKAA